MESLQKNQLQDFDWALGINRYSLRLMGIWPADQDKKSKSLQTVLRIPLMILVLFCGLFLPQMYGLALVIKQLPLVIDNIVSSIPAFTSCVKLFFIWRSKTVLQPVIDSALQDYLRPKSKSEELTMRREAWRGRLITIADYSTIGMCFAGIVVLPMLGFNVRIINNVTDYGKRHLIMQSYYPYDYSRSPVYELTHLLQFLGCSVMAMAVTIPDDYFCALILHISAQFEILGLQLETLAMDGTRADGKQELSDFIERHLQLNRMISAVEKSFEFVIAAQIFFTSITCCCLGVQVLQMLSSTGEKPTTLQVVTFAGTFSGVLIHTLIDCFVSENLASRSSEISLKIYSCRWYVLPCDKIRCLVPMMLVANTPLRIRAAKIMPMSLTTYCSIVKTTFSYISVLVAVSRGR